MENKKKCDLFFPSQNTQDMKMGGMTKVRMSYRQHSETWDYLSSGHVLNHLSLIQQSSITGYIKTNRARNIYNSRP